MTTTVLLVDDSPDILSSLEMILDDESDLSCVGTLRSADELVSQVATQQPQVVVLDLTMPGRPPLEALVELRDRFPKTRVIVCSGYDDPATLDAVTDAGAWGFVNKHSDPDEILAAIRAVASGETVFPHLD